MTAPTLFTAAMHALQVPRAPRTYLDVACPIFCTGWIVSVVQ